MARRATPIFEIARAFQNKIKEDVNYSNEFETNFRNNFLERQRIPEEMRKTQLAADQAHWDRQDLSNNWGIDLETSKRKSQFALQDSQRDLDEFADTTEKRSLKLREDIARLKQDAAMEPDVFKREQIEAQIERMEAETDFDNIDTILETRTETTMDDLDQIRRQRELGVPEHETAMVDAETDYERARGERSRIAGVNQRETRQLRLDNAELQTALDIEPDESRRKVIRSQMALNDAVVEQKDQYRTHQLAKRELTLALANVDEELKTLPDRNLANRLATQLDILGRERLVAADEEITEHAALQRQKDIEQLRADIELLPDSNLKTQLQTTYAIMQANADIDMHPQKVELEKQNTSYAINAINALISNQDNVNRITELETLRDLALAEDERENLTDLTDRQRLERKQAIELLEASLLTTMPAAEAQVVQSQLSLMRTNASIDAHEQDVKNAQLQREALTVQLQSTLDNAATVAEYDTAFAEYEAAVMQNLNDNRDDQFALENGTRAEALADLARKTQMEPDVTKKAILQAKFEAMVAENNLRAAPELFAEQEADRARARQIRTDVEKLDDLQRSVQIAQSENTLQEEDNKKHYRALVNQAEAACQGMDQACVFDELGQIIKQKGSKMEPRLRDQIKRDIFEAAAPEFDILKQHTRLSILAKARPGTPENKKYHAEVVDYESAISGTSGNLPLLSRAFANGLISASDLDPASLDKLIELNNILGTPVADEQGQPLAIDGPSGDGNVEMSQEEEAEMQAEAEKQMEAPAPQPEPEQPADTPVDSDGYTPTPEAEEAQSKIGYRYRGILTDPLPDSVRDMEDLIDSINELDDNMDSIDLSESDRSNVREAIIQRNAEILEFLTSTPTEAQ